MGNTWEPSFAVVYGAIETDVALYVRTAPGAALVAHSDLAAARTPRRKFCCSEAGAHSQLRNFGRRQHILLTGRRRIRKDGGSGIHTLRLVSELYGASATGAG